MKERILNMKKQWLKGGVPLALLALTGACSAGNDEPAGAQPSSGVDSSSAANAKAEGEPIASKLLYRAALSETASLEVRVDELGSMEVSVTGSSAEDPKVLKALRGLRGATANEIVQTLAGVQAPEAVTQAQLRIDLALRAEAKAIANGVAIPSYDSPETEASTTPALTSPQQRLQSFSGGEARFKDMLCDGGVDDAFPGAGVSGRTCWVRTTGLSSEAWVQRNGWKHVLAAAANNHDIRFRTYYWGCKFLSCAYREVRDDRLPAGHWRYSSYYSTSNKESRKVRIDAWDQDDMDEATAYFGIEYNEELPVNNPIDPPTGTFCSEISGIQCWASNGTLMSTPTWSYTGCGSTVTAANAAALAASGTRVCGSYPCCDVRYTAVH